MIVTNSLQLDRYLLFQTEKADNLEVQDGVTQVESHL